MSLRTAVLTAAVGALLVWSPTEIAGQVSGLDHAAEATATAESKAGWKNGQATGRATTLPPGIASKSGDRALPPGLRRWVGEPEPDVQPEPEPDVQPEPEPQPDEECGNDIAFIDGQLVYVDCNGEVVDGQSPFGTF